MVLYYYIYIIHSQNLARIYNTEEEEKKLDEMGDLMAGMGNTMSLVETPYGFER